MRARSITIIYEERESGASTTSSSAVEQLYPSPPAIDYRIAAFPQRGMVLGPGRAQRTWVPWSFHLSPILEMGVLAHTSAKSKARALPIGAPASPRPRRADVQILAQLRPSSRMRLGKLINRRSEIRARERTNMAHRNPRAPHSANSVARQPSANGSRRPAMRSPPTSRSWNWRPTR